MSSDLLKALQPELAELRELVDGSAPKQSPKKSARGGRRIWSIQDASDNFEALYEQAALRPQLIVRRGDQQGCVLVSRDLARRLIVALDTLSDLVASGAVDALDYFRQHPIAGPRPIVVADEDGEDSASKSTMRSR